MATSSLLCGASCAGCVTLSALLLAKSAGAQVNVEPLRHQIDADGFGARLSASISSYAGNTKGVVFGGSALLGGRSERHFAYSNLAGDYATLNGTVSVAKWFLHARYNYRLHPTVAWEVFGQIESDRFRRVGLRELLGTGPRLTVFESEAASLYYGTSYMFEHTSYTVDDAVFAEERSLHRWNNYLAVTLRPEDRISLSSVAYVQPRFDELSDYHVLTIHSLGFTISQRLRSRLDCMVRYASVHPADVNGADVELKSSIELVF